MTGTTRHAFTTQSREAHRELTVGAEIREVRKARGLTLKQLSDLTGRSVANISRIERGETAITADSLNDIGKALNVDPKWFFPSRSGSGELERSYVVRAAARRPLSGLYARPFDELGFRDELLSSSLAGEFYMTAATYPAGCSGEQVPREGYVFAGEQHGVVVQGRLNLYLGDEVIALNKGDSFSYPSTLPHRFANPGKEDAVLIWATSPVQINW